MSTQRPSAAVIEACTDGSPLIHSFSAFFLSRQAQEVHAEVRKWLAENVSAEVAAATRIQYGGSGEAAGRAGAG